MDRSRSCVASYDALAGMRKIQFADGDVVQTSGAISWAYSCWPPKLCVSLRGTVRRIMTITLTDWCRRVRVAAVVAVCTALSLGRGSSLEPVKAAASQAAAAASQAAAAAPQAAAAAPQAAAAAPSNSLV